MRKILVSSCLLGDPVRYDGQAKPCLDKRFLQWKEEGRMIPICPEVFGGLPTPRPRQGGDEIISSTGKTLQRIYSWRFGQ